MGEVAKDGKTFVLVALIFVFGETGRDNNRCRYNVALIKIVLCKLMIEFSLGYVLNYLSDNIEYFLSHSRERFDVLQINN